MAIQCIHLSNHVLYFYFLHDPRIYCCSHLQMSTLPKVIQLKDQHGTPHEIQVQEKHHASSQDEEDKAASGQED